jgi:hypothetical protein
MKLQALHEFPAQETQLFGRNTASLDVLRIARMSLSDQGHRRLEPRRTRCRGEPRQVVLVVRFSDGLGHSRIIGVDLPSFNFHDGCCSFPRQLTEGTASGAYIP